MIHFIFDFATLLFIKIPILFLIIWLLAAVSNAFWGGPIWLWAIGLSILGTIYIKEEFDKEKRKNELGN